jgi:outer membrane protein assembly factor BamD
MSFRTLAALLRPDGAASRRLLVVGLLAAALGAGCAGVNRPLAPATATDQLRIARLRYEHRDYTEAITLLKGYIQYRAEAADLDEAHFLLGMCHVHRKEWPLAAGEFVVVTSDYADSPRLADAQYWLGISYWRQSRSAPYDQEPTRRALSQWDRFLALYPDHPRVDEARGFRTAGRTRLAEKALRNGRLYLTLKRYKPALIYFDEVVKEYPDTKWIDAAQVGRAEALLGQDKPGEARTALELALPSIKDADARDRARDLLKKLPAKSTAPPAAGDAG